MTDQRRPPPQQQASQPRPSAMVSWRTVHRRKNADYLFAEDIGELGTRIDVEIVDSDIGEVRGRRGKEKLPWLAFRGAKKKLGLNRGNSKTMETITGTDIVGQWRGW